GFISKEFLFEAQLASSWELVPLAIAVLVNAVMVGVAGVITLRPFFIKPAKPVAVVHGETFSLVAPPLLLAALGLTISLDPEWITDNALRPAAVAVYGKPVEVALSVWHGLTPMLALSAVVVTIGALIIRYWQAIHTMLRSRERIERYSIESAWERGLFRFIAGGAALTGRIEHGDLRGYVASAVIAMAAVIGFAMAASGAPVRLELPSGPMPPAHLAMGLIAVTGALVAAASRHVLVSLVGVGITGFAVAITFLFNGAPDLALTQFTVEVLVVVLLTALLLALPLRTPDTRTRREQGRDVLVAASLGAVLFAALADMSAGRVVSQAGVWFGQMSYLAGYGSNVVNVILVDFRAFDTLGETVVIAAAAVLAGSLLARRRGEVRDTAEAGNVHYSFAAASKPLFWVLLAASVVLLLRGHNQPGGGFVGGLVAALAFGVLSLAHGARFAARTLRFEPLTLCSAGVAIGILSGLPAMLLADGVPYLSHLWWEPGGGLPKLSTTITFDIGVYLVVLGAVLSFLFGLQKEAAR
ncbi:MAG: DUF4040 domain-containing protein, partial [Porphyrobacter sp.]|nr:DUF4040 domain-containing protein [Porphyrobacter sp.]